ncbi:MAG: hypothetical protein V8T45_11085 [Oscillospiraceae bacterium]
MEKKRPLQRKRLRLKIPRSEKKSYGPEVDPILEEGDRALSEMARLYCPSRTPRCGRR